MMVYCLFFRYKTSEPINVTVVDGAPTIVNFTLIPPPLDEQGNLEQVDYPRVVGVMSRVTPLERMIALLNVRDF